MLYKKINNEFALYLALHFLQTSSLPKPNKNTFDAFCNLLIFVLQTSHSL
ncbi:MULTISPECIES: hypothetical protein [Campylobacter]|uniref:Uncharacterized protein n=1 Tax=Campylobacter peloridis TaxID=488546 RepID=A0ABX6TXN2_9BACT|nr:MULTISPECIES: hypothetical protein [Campylobacter]EDP6837985.1 hypothetical protein [Campylobacter lari]EFD4863688.1 hypothetical protein [Campylobacter coli]EGK8039176.1 hypothetical protein [Campylobacter lari]EGW1699976.1 hypothetical protein [Campylobacter jejuni]EHN0711652.1 hypothetical protein [Campylobacter coli]